jgi:integrase
MKFTKTAVVALTTAKPDHVVWDDELPGFGVRMRGDTKRWLIQYRIGLQQRRESLGDVRRISLEHARRIARQRFAQIELGQDPVADKAASRAAVAKAALTLGAVADRYLDSRRGVIRASSYHEASRYFVVQWAPLRDRPIGEIARADIAAQLHVIIKKHGRTSAARARANLSAMYTRALGEALCDVNPVIGTNDPADDLKARDRVLSDAELRLVWDAAGDDDFGRITKLLILLGARRQEIGFAKWSDIDFDSGVLTIPAEVAKNGHTLELPLPSMALEILNSTPRRGDHVFGAKGTGFTGWSVATAAFRQRITKPMAPFRLHDLRRSMRTGLGRIGVRPDVSELLINHVKGGVQAVYDRYSYEGEKRAALARWADHVLAVVEGRAAKVISLDERRA